MPSPSIPIEPSPDHGCRCGEPANWKIEDSFWRYGKLQTRERFYCHAHHNQLLARRAKREETMLLRLNLRYTYDSLLKARRALRQRGIPDPTTPDIAQSRLGERHRSWSSECS